MFGPNVRCDSECEDQVYDHRSDAFRKIYRECQTLLGRVFGLEDYRFVIVTGPGTLVNEIVIASVKGPLEVFYNSGEFGGRLEKTVEQHWGNEAGREMEVGDMDVAFETSKAEWQPGAGQDGSRLQIADMVSAFPYYMPEECVNVFTTVSSKQLGALPVLGIIGIHKRVNVAEVFRELPGSILCLRSHLEAAERREARNTAAIPLYVDLRDRLREFDVAEQRRRIDCRGKTLENILDDEISGAGPVRLLSEGPVAERLAEKFGLYRGAEGYEVFLYSGTDEEWDQLYEACEKEVRKQCTRSLSCRRT